MKSYKQLMEEFENDTLSTQLTRGNVGTYRKTGEHLAKFLPSNSRVISIGSGAVHNADALRTSLGSGHTIHEHEPNPGKRPADRQPEYTKMDGSDIPSNHYHAVVHHNVLNVVTPDVRNNIMATSFRTVKEGGHIVIGTRANKGDVSTIKNFEPAEEAGAKWVKKTRKGGEVFHSYQKGFDGDELKNYAEDYAKQHGHTVEVKRLSGIAGNAIHIKVVKKA